MPQSRKNKVRFGGKSKRNRKSPSSQSTGSKIAKPKIFTFREQMAPDSVETVLEYGDAINFSVGGSYGTWQFRANSAFDPDYTYTGAQPVGFDQWTAFYALMKTFRCKIEVVGAPSTKPLVLVVYASPSTTAASSIQSAISQRGAKYKIIPIYATGKVTLDINMPEFFGVDKEEFGDTLYGSSVGSNPSAACYVTAQLYNMDATAVHASSIFAKLSMHVQFNSPTYLAISLNSKKSSKSEENPDQISTQASKLLKTSLLGNDVNRREEVDSGHKPRRTCKQILAEFDLID